MEIYEMWEELRKIISEKIPKFAVKDAGKETQAQKPPILQVVKLAVYSETINILLDSEAILNVMSNS